MKEIRKTSSLTDDSQPRITHELIKPKSSRLWEVRLKASVR